jgi:Lipase.
MSVLPNIPTWEKIIFLQIQYPLMDLMVQVKCFILFSGLDPADPYFSGTESIVRLDPTDATFVDIVHTDAAPFVKGGESVVKISNIS